jgi:hypothetical protein
MRYFLVDGEDIKTNEPIEVIYNNRNFNMQIDKSPFLGIGTKKTADYLHRTATTAYPCCLPTLGEFSRSWSCKTCRGAKIMISAEDCNVFLKVFFS